MATRNAAVLSRLLCYGDDATLQGLADEVAGGDADLTGLLAATARSAEGLGLRARCLQVLGRALETAPPAIAGSILDALLAPPVGSSV